MYFKLASNINKIISSDFTISKILPLAPNNGVEAVFIKKILPLKILNKQIKLNKLTNHNLILTKAYKISKITAVSFKISKILFEASNIETKMLLLNL